MIPVEATPEQVAYWTERQGDQRQVVIGGPAEGPEVIPCPALVGTEFTVQPAQRPGDGDVMTATTVVHVAWRLDEIELAHLARGGTLWLTTWGGLPIHDLEVVPSEDQR